MLAPLKKGLLLSSAAMNVQSERMFIVSQNIANSQTHPSKPGEKPYARQMIFFKPIRDDYFKEKFLKTYKITNDRTPFNKVYSPNDPAADKNGYILESNVRPIIELSDMREASRAHEAALRTFERILNMMQNTISILKNNG